jgi:hypothetical protein
MTGVDERDLAECASSHTPVIQLTVGFNHVVAADPCPTWLRDFLSYVARTFRPGGPLGYQEAEEQVSLELTDQLDRKCSQTPTSTTRPARGHSDLASTSMRTPA